MRRVVFLLIAFTSISACKKHCGETAPVRIKKIVSPRFPFTTEYTYTMDWKLERINAGGAVTTYVYSRDSIYMMRADTIAAIYLLNTAGLAGTYYWHYPLDRKYLFAYDGNDLLIQTKSYVGDTLYFLKSNIYQDNNLVQTDHDGIFPQAPEFYTYYEVKVNTIGNDNVGQSFLGRSSYNLVKEGFDLLSDTSLQRYYSYEFDSKGRVAKQFTSRDSTRVPYDSLLFTYY